MKILVTELPDDKQKCPFFEECVALSRCVYICKISNEECDLGCCSYSCSGLQVDAD